MSDSEIVDLVNGSTIPSDLLIQIFELVSMLLKMKPYGSFHLPLDV
jgi:hypothetical protein